MEHPIHILPPDGTMSPEQMSALADNCSEREIHPDDTSLTVFTFRAADVNDSRDRIIVANPAGGRYKANRAENCICETVRSELDCDCQRLPCHSCGRELSAMNVTCDMAYCLYDECIFCSHGRETCDAEQIEKAIRQACEENAKRYPKEDDALAAYAAVADVLGADSGDAPNFPIARRVLANMAQSDPAAERWTFTDGSAIRIYPPNHAWLEAEDNRQEKTA